MSTRGPAPRSAARRHVSMNPKALSGLAHGRPIRAEAGCGTRHALAAPTLVLPRRTDRAAEQRKGGQRCGYRTAEPTRKSVHPTGESERRRGRTGIGRCGYLPPTSTRLAVDCNGERRHPLEPRADRGVDIRPPTRLETLCNRPVSAPPVSPAVPGIVDIPHPRPIGTLCIRWVRTRLFCRANPCRTARERPPPRPRAASRLSPRFRGNRFAHAEMPAEAVRRPARKLSQLAAKTCAVFLTPAPLEQDEKKLSRPPAKK